MTFRLELDDDDESWLQVMMYATELSSAFLHLPKAARQSFFRDFISSWVVLESQSSVNFLAAAVMFAASSQHLHAASPSVVSLRQAAFLVLISSYLSLHVSSTVKSAVLFGTAHAAEIDAEQLESVLEWSWLIFIAFELQKKRKYEKQFLKNLFFFPPGLTHVYVSAASSVRLVFPEQLRLVMLPPKAISR